MTMKIRKAEEAKRIVEDFREDFFNKVKIQVHRNDPEREFMFSVDSDRTVYLTALELCSQRKARSELMFLPISVIPIMTRQDYVNFVQDVRDRAVWYGSDRRLIEQ